MQNTIIGWAMLKCFDSKIKERSFLLFITVGSVIPMIASALGPPVSDFKPFLSIGLPITAAFLFLKGRKLLLLLFCVVNQMLDFLLEMLTLIVVTFVLPHYSPEGIEEYDADRLMISLIFMLLVLPLKYLYAKVWNKLANKDASARVSWMFLLFPIGQLLVIFCFMYQNMAVEEILGITSEVVSAFGFTILAALDVLFLFYISRIEKNSRLEAEIAVMKYAGNLEREYYRSIESKRYETAKIRHDIRNQMLVVSQLVESDNISEMRQLIGDIEQQLEHTGEAIFCSVPIIEAVMVQKKEVCAENDIRLEADINISSTGDISLMHLCSIFSNLMDNAINANLSLPEECERYIRITAHEKQGYIAVKTENPSDRRNGKLQPDRSTGYGLKILRDISAGYGGDFSAECRDGKCCCMLSADMAKKISERMG